MAIYPSINKILQAGPQFYQKHFTEFMFTKKIMLKINPCLIIALMVAGDLQSAFGQTAMVKHYKVQIQANSPDWVNPDGITLKKGEFVLFSATGRATLGTSYLAQNTTPTGITNFGYGFYNRSIKFSHGSLLSQNGDVWIGTLTWDKKKSEEYSLEGKYNIKPMIIPEQVKRNIDQEKFAGNYFVSERDQPLSFVLNDRKIDDNRGAFTVDIFIMSGKCPPLAASFDFGNYVDLKKGVADFSMADDAIIQFYANRSDNGGLWFQEKTPEGHSYLAINLIGKFNIPPQDAATILRKNIGEVFPRGGAKDVANPIAKAEVLLNHSYKITYGDFVVIAVQVSKYHFTFKTDDGHHILRGTALHGIFKDADGNLYMFQQGRGIEDESTARQGLNFLLAPGMWEAMATNLKEFLN